MSSSGKGTVLRGNSLHRAHCAKYGPTGTAVILGRPWTRRKKYFVPWDAIHEANPQEILDRRERVSLPPLLVITHGKPDVFRPGTAASTRRSQRMSSAQRIDFDIDQRPAATLCPRMPARLRRGVTCRGGNSICLSTKQILRHGGRGCIASKAATRSPRRERLPRIATASGMHCCTATIPANFGNFASKRCARAAEARDESIPRRTGSFAESRITSSSHRAMRGFFWPDRCDARRKPARCRDAGSTRGIRCVLPLHCRT